jgi:hypothetical protein
MTQQADGRSALPFLENALLWAMRAWVIGHSRKLNVSPQIQNMFDGLGTPGAVDPLNGFMSAISSNATRRVNIDCVCYPGVSADESLLLDVLALQQEGYEEDGRMLLGAFTTPDACSIACDKATRLVLVLNAAGHFLPRGAEAIRRHAFRHRATCADSNMANLYLN